MDPVEREVCRLAQWRLLALALALVTLVCLAATLWATRTAEAVYRVPEALEVVRP